MTAEDAIQIESSQRQHYETILYQERSYAIALEAEYARFAKLKPRLFRDGDQWCVLFGNDLMTGIAGFGDTPHEAVIMWDKQWTTKI